MSFLSILLFASAFYFAHARPDYIASDTTQAASDTAPEQPQVPVFPEVPAAPITDTSEYQHRMFGLLQDVSKVINQYMTPLMSKLEVKKQDEPKDMGMNEFASYLNYLAKLEKLGIPGLNFDYHADEVADKASVTNSPILTKFALMYKVLFLMQEIENEKDKGDDKTHDDFLPRDEVILQLESYYPLDLVGDVLIEEAEEEGEDDEE